MLPRRGGIGEVAEAHAGKIAQLVRADAHTLPFVDRKFDAAISILTHTDLDDLTAALVEAFRVLQPGSRFVLLGVTPALRTRSSRVPPQLTLKTQSR